MKREIRDYRRKVERPCLALQQIGIGDKAFWCGVLATAHGIVSVYRQVGDMPFVRMDIVKDGQFISREWLNFTASDRRLVTLGRRFAEEIYGGKS